MKGAVKHEADIIHFDLCNYNCLAFNNNTVFGERVELYMHNAPDYLLITCLNVLTAELLISFCNFGQTIYIRKVNNVPAPEFTIRL